ncbi:MAG: hypothetical protein WA635_04045 [Gallionella sp.]
MAHKQVVKSTPIDTLTELPALGVDSDSIAKDFRRYFSHTLGPDKNCNSIHYLYTALAYTQRDRLMERWKNTHYAYDESDNKRAY